MPSPLREGQTDMPIIHLHLGDVNSPILTPSFFLLSLSSYLPIPSKPIRREDYCIRPQKFKLPYTMLKPFSIR